MDNDAVGAATLALRADISADKRFHATLLAKTSDVRDADVEKVSSLSELLLNPAFLKAEIIIYIFAIYSDLLDAILVGNGTARQIVRFHNVTPQELVAENERAIIERSIGQLRNFDVADEIWADSEENRDELVRRAVGGNRILVMPLAVEPLVTGKLGDKQLGEIGILYVGRFVPSKGLHDLIRAFGLLRHLSGVPFQARLVGNLKHASSEYLKMLRDLIIKQGLEGLVHIEGPMSKSGLAGAYASSHILVSASRHEGFCVPVIEGMAAGCVPVTYANSNLKNIAAGVGRLARIDEPESLADALTVVLKALHQGHRAPETVLIELDRATMRIKDFDEAAADHVAKFDRGVCRARVLDRLDQGLNW